MFKSFRRMITRINLHQKHKAPKAPFRFITEDADIYFLKYKGKHSILRIDRNKPYKWKAVKNFSKHAIFNALFPNNSLKPLGIYYHREKGNKKYGMVSEIIKQRSRDYKAYLNWVYIGDRPRPIPQPVIRHKQFVDKIATPLAEHVEKTTGIELNDNPLNVENANGRPLFFEIENVDKQQLMTYLELIAKGAIEESKMKMLNKWIAQL